MFRKMFIFSYLNEINDVLIVLWKTLKGMRHFVYILFIIMGMDRLAAAIKLSILAILYF
jgi:hypothetical protein